MSANAAERDIMDRKIISVSKKRQITIPLQFYKHLGLGMKLNVSLKMVELLFNRFIGNLVNFPLRF